MRAFSLPARLRNMDLGLWAAFGSSILWGNLPLYWWLLRDVSPGLILGHRIIWSCVFLVPLLVCGGRLGEAVAAARDLKTMRRLALSSVILGCNWLTYIWAVNNGQVLEASLGYYINPLFTICMGMVIFRDKPSRLRGIAIGIAAAGVSTEIALTGAFSWVAFTLAALFALYGLLHKLTPVESLPGLTLETLILAPFALGYILWSGAAQGAPSWGNGTGEMLLLAGTGVITSVPLILFTYGARHLPFTTLGLLQYIAPTCTFLIGLFVFGETFSLGRGISFSAIWIALALYTFDSFRGRPPRPAEKRASGPE